MKRGWRIVMIIIGIAIAFAAVCIAVGMITGAEPSRIYSVFERLFELRYNINLDELINTWFPQVIQTISEAF